MIWFSSGLRYASAHSVSNCVWPWLRHRVFLYRKVNRIWGTSHLSCRVMARFRQTFQNIHAWQSQTLNNFDSGAWTNYGLRNKNSNNLREIGTTCCFSTWPTLIEWYVNKRILELKNNKQGITSRTNASKCIAMSITAFSICCWRSSAAMFLSLPPTKQSIPMHVFSYPTSIKGIPHHCCINQQHFFWRELQFCGQPKCTPICAQL